MRCLEAKSAETKSVNSSTRPTKEAEGKALFALVTEPQRARIDSAEKKETPASIPVLVHQVSDGCSGVAIKMGRRQRFDYLSGLLRTWCGPENSERYHGWIEKGIPGCR